VPFVVAFFPLKLSAGFNPFPRDGAQQQYSKRKNDLFSLHFANVKRGSVFGLNVFEDLNIFSDKDSYSW
jgi:hypothetical protein